MSLWRHFPVAFFSLVIACQASAENDPGGCGKVLGGPDDSNTIYVLCPTLSGLSRAEVYRIIESARVVTPQVAGKVEIVFVSDPAIVELDSQPRDMEARLAKWGDSFVGVFDADSGFLIYRSSVDSKWRKLQLEN